MIQKNIVIYENNEKITFSKLKLIFALKNKNQNLNYKINDIISKFQN